MGYTSLNDTGVFNFDADAYVRGANVFGAPQMEAHQQYPSYGVEGGQHLAGHPQSDAFIRNEEEGESKITGWKKFAAIALTGSLALFAAKKISPDWFSSLPFSKTAREAKRAKEKAKMRAEIIEELKNEKNGEGFFKSIVTKIKALPPWGKVLGGGIIALVAASGIYKVIGDYKAKKAADPEAESKSEKEIENKIGHPSK